MSKQYLGLAFLLVAAEAAAGMAIGKYYIKTERVDEVRLPTMRSGDYVYMVKPWEDAAASFGRGTGNASGEQTFSVVPGEVPEGTLIFPDDCQATSFLMREGDPYSNDVYKTIDGLFETSWQEGESGNGEGSELTYTFDQSYPLSAICFYLGNWSRTNGADYYELNNRPSVITITINGFDWQVPFEDIMTPHAVYFFSPVYTDSVVLTIDQVYEGSRWSDTVISEIEFFEG